MFSDTASEADIRVDPLTNVIAAELPEIETAANLRSHPDFGWKASATGPQFSGKDFEPGRFRHFRSRPLAVIATAQISATPKATSQSQLLMN
ncbi:hypothetical protein B0T39_10945 [Chromobacterium haemolyticum]|nr:hypothetical protein B0T39_10945 [Chromobacterium haemolyticum]